MRSQPGRPGYRQTDTCRRRSAGTSSAPPPTAAAPTWGVSAGSPAAGRPQGAAGVAGSSVLRMAGHQGLLIDVQGLLPPLHPQPHLLHRALAWHSSLVHHHLLPLPISKGEPVPHSESPGVGGVGLLTLVLQPGLPAGVGCHQGLEAPGTSLAGGVLATRASWMSWGSSRWAPAEQDCVVGLPRELPLNLAHEYVLPGVCGGDYLCHNDRK